MVEFVSGMISMHSLYIRVVAFKNKQNQHIKNHTNWMLLMKTITFNRFFFKKKYLHPFLEIPVERGVVGSV